MPRDSSGNYTLPAGNPVITGTIIEAPWANSTMDDIAVQLNNVLTRDGSLGPTTQFALVPGTISRPGLGFNNETSLGLARLRAGTVSVVSGGAEVMGVGSSGVTIPGDLTVNGDINFGGSGVVSQIIPGAGISVSPDEGIGAVTITNLYLPTLTGAWNWNDALSGDPGVGRIGGNAVDLVNIDKLRISKTDVDGREYSFAGNSVGSTLIVTPDGSSISGSAKYLVTGNPTVFEVYAEFPVSAQSGSGDVPNNNRTFVTVLPAQGDNNGTVTGFYFTNANGITGTVTNPTTTPTLLLSLGAITPSSVTASGVIRGSNIAAGATVSGTNTGDQTIPVTRIIAGTNITISPTSGLGDVTINSTASGGGGTGTVTSVSASGTEGVATSVSNPTSNPTITIGLHDITPWSVDTDGNITYRGALTGGTGIVNLGTNQFYKSAAGKFGYGQVASTAMHSTTGPDAGTTQGNSSIMHQFTTNGLVTSMGHYRDTNGSTTTSLQWRIWRGNQGFIALGDTYSVLGVGSNNVFVANADGSANVNGALVTNGNITSGGDVTANSDERLKHRWEPVSDDFIDRLAGVKSGTFSMRAAEDNSRRVGVSAQSLHRVLPEAVHANEDGYLSVAYGNAALVAAIELSRRVLALEKVVYQ